jgi:hypothetical protein
LNLLARLQQSRLEDHAGWRQESSKQRPLDAALLTPYVDGGGTLDTILFTVFIFESA